MESIRAQPLWYDTSYLTPINQPKNKLESIAEEQVLLLKNRGEHLLTDITERFAISIQPSKQSGLKKSNFSGLSESDKSFIHRILTSGTSTDKLSALTLLVSSSPLHSRNHLTTLLNLSKKKNREESGKTLRSLVEWLRGAGNPQAGGLPPRKLKYFRDQPDLSVIAHTHIIWAFEDWLKNWYLDLLRVIEALSHDPIVNTRSQTLTHLFYLLKDKPEQEQNLLTLLVNKLGDSNKMICSRSSHYLLQLLQVHPFIKPIVAREISALVLKPMVKNNNNNNEDPSLRHHDHARYYGSITLNQIPLVKGEHEVSNKLIHLYFELFNDILGKEAQTEEEVQAKENEGNLNEKNEEDLEAENIEEQELIKKQFKNKKAGFKKNGTGKKSSKVIAEEEALADKKSKLVAAILTGLNRAFPYGSIDKQILKGYMNTVLYGTLIDYRLLISPSKHGLYLNLLFKSVKSDPNHKRVLAFIKRIVQILPYHQPPFICSTLVLLGHLFSSKSNSGQLFSRRPEGEQLTDKEQYDGRKRDPSYANADKSCLWELVPLLSHYHPAVKLNATQLLTGEPISSSVDLTHHTLSNFLDKFVYRQPKKSALKKINENVLMNSKSFLNTNEEEIPVDEVFFHKYFKKKEIIEKKKEAQVNKNKSKKGVTEDQDFGGRGGSDDGSTAEESSEEENERSILPGYDDDDDEGTEENDEEEVWKAMKKSMGKELKKAMPDDDDDGVSEDEWSEIDPAQFDDSDDEDDLKLKELLADHDNDEVSDLDNSLMFSDNEEIQVSGLDDDSQSEQDQSSHKLNPSRKRKTSQQEELTTKKKEMKDGQVDDDGNKSSKKKRKTWKTLPTFASADDYQHLLADQEESS
ncbi:hypothetical protein H4Q26_007575 [Puccinia striiformis f. sp. tritici PST-130]|nr:hypothetical protein H4Q26_007575 [Puccinia striiformis f. sp. tritici PST-130]